MIYKQAYSFPLPPSKSLLARRLILEVLQGKGLPTYLQEEQVTLPEDIRYLYQALECFLGGEQEVCVGESGTAMRLMTALLAFKVKKETKLYGLGRQHQRPIYPLVNALRDLGAEIDYLEEEGFPPLLFKPSNFKPKKVDLDTSQSSQYLTALLLLAPLVSEGIFAIDTRQYSLVSAPYAFMTMAVLRSSAYNWTEEAGLFTYQGRGVTNTESFFFEADWTAASYAYELCSFSELGQEVYLPNLIPYSIQGDSRYLPEFFEQFGVKTKTIDSKGMLLFKEQEVRLIDRVSLDCAECPDLVPTFVATCVVHNVPFCFEGIEHLKIKESNRLEVLKRECAKVGVELYIGEGTLSWNGERTILAPSSLVLNPEGDHRMAMALAPMMSKLSKEGIIIKNPEVVAKSFPNYWDNLSIFAYSVNGLD